MLIALTIALCVFVCVAVGLCVYLVIGSWVAFHIAALCSLITICVTIGIVSIVRIIKNRSISTSSPKNKQKNRFR